MQEGYRYQWPASGLTAKEMGALYRWKQRTGTPINELIRQAIEYCDKIIGDDNERSVQDQNSH